eukprot:366357-Chlamydomonas_euryale.AAC.1
MCIRDSRQMLPSAAAPRVLSAPAPARRPRIRPRSSSRRAPQTTSLAPADAHRPTGPRSGPRTRTCTRLHRPAGRRPTGRRTRRHWRRPCGRSRRGGSSKTRLQAEGRVRTDVCRAFPMRLAKKSRFLKVDLAALWVLLRHALFIYEMQAREEVVRNWMDGLVCGAIRKEDVLRWSGVTLLRGLVDGRPLQGSQDGRGILPRQNFCF